jgi:hypothetical protein
VEPPLRAQLLLAVDCGLLLHSLSPVRRNPTEVGHRVDTRRLDQLSLAAPERLRVSFTR